jgi:hypothetical protein
MVHILPGSSAKYRNSYSRSKQSFRQQIEIILGVLLLVCTCCASSFAGHNPHQVNASKSGLDFGDVLIGTSSTKTVTITNTGRKTANISGATITGSGFSYSGPGFPLTLPVGESVILSVTFIPDVAGTSTGSLTLSGNAVVSPDSVSLTGNGVQPAIVLSATPSSVNFGSVLVGSSSSQTASLLNSGSGNVSISQASVVGSGFAIRGLALPLTLGPGQSSAFAITFLPTAAGSVTGSVSLVSDAPNSPTVISLSAAGVQPLMSVVPSSVSFGDVTVGLTNTQTVTVSNPGTADLSVTQSAGPSTGFSLGGLVLPLTLAPGQSSSFTLSFSPTTSGTLTSSVALVSNAPTSPSAISLSGSGVSATLQLSPSTTSLDFGSVALGTTSTLSVTLTNTGNSSVSVSQISVTGSGFSVTGLSLPISVAPGQSTSFNVDFAPTVAGSVTGSASVASTAGNSPLSISLSGSGLQASHSVNLNWLASSSAVAGYYVYTGTQASGPFTRLNSTPIDTTAFTDNSVQSGQTYYYYVTAVDSSGMESSSSNEVSAPVP